MDLLQYLGNIADFYLGFTLTFFLCSSSLTFIPTADNIKSNQGRQISAPLSSTGNVVDMDTKSQVVNYISNKRSCVIWRNFQIL